MDTGHTVSERAYVMGQNDRCVRYQITYKGKKYISIAEDAEKAFAKFADRPVFGGNTIITNYSLMQYDADTRGKKWAQFECGWCEDLFLCMCEATK